MQIFREFNPKLIEVSHIKIGVQLLKLWNLEVQIWVRILKSIGITKKLYMKMGWKCDPLSKEIFECKSLGNSTPNS